MKIAIVHDHFLYFGGAERVLLNLLKIYPNADVFLAFVSTENKKLLKKYTSGNVYCSRFDLWPLSHRYPEIYKQALFYYWEHLDLSGYDLVISSSHSFSSKSVIARNHVSYIYTPPRYLYEEYSETRWIQRQPFKFLFTPLFNWLRKRDFEGAQRPDKLIAISKTVQARIKKYYKRDSEVIYPPVEMPKKYLKRNPQYFLCMSRLVKQKGIDLAIKACNQLKVPLVVVGTGPQEKYLKSIAGPTIRFLGFVPDNQMDKIYSCAKALIYTSIQEDFGLVPLEAMAHGVLVIGHKSGGVVETVAENDTGIFFEELSVDALVEALERFQRMRFLPSKTQSIKRFYFENFKKQLTRIVFSHHYST